MSSKSILCAVWSLAVLVAVLPSCAGPTQDEPPPAAETAWSIHAFVDSKDGRKAIEFGPVAEVSSPSSRRNLAKLTAGIQTKSGSDAGTPPMPTADGLASATGVSAWALLWGAARECGVAGDLAGASWTSRRTAVVPPWSGEGWFVFDQPPTSCDELINYEETSLCIADKLVEVADAVGTVRWDRVAGGPPPPSSTIPAGPWVIPPQADKDKFIVRDLALYTLGHIARLDSWIIDDPAGGMVCSRLYAEARVPSTVNPRAALLFGTTLGIKPLYPPSQVTVTADAGVLPLIEERLSFEAHVLRAAGRMMRDLVRESVYADLAGAEQRGARALDPRKANLIAWAKADAQNGPFNSLGHALRILTGRWEMGPNNPDPMCGGVGALGLLAPHPGFPLLPSAYGPDESGRVKDLAIDTPGRAKAVRLFETTGVIIPPAVLNGMSSETLVGGLGDVLVGMRLRTDGGTEADLGDQATAIRNTVAALSDYDLRFAADRVFRTWQLVVNADDTSSVMPGMGGLTADSFATRFPPDVQIVRGGMTRGRLPIDAMARAGGFLEASQCNELYGWEQAVKADPVPSSYTGLGIPYGEQYQHASFQDVFAMAQALERRLVVLREEAVLEPNRAVAAEEIARSGIGELSSWAGAGRVIVSSDTAPTSPRPDHLKLRLAGFSNKELGIEEESQWAAGIKLVYGQPWVAECVARLRSDCPDLSSSVVSGTPFAVEAGPGVRRDYGTTADVRIIDFDLTGMPLGFAPFRDYSEPLPQAHLYLVGKDDPKSPGHGWILGTVSLSRPSSVYTVRPELSTGFVVAPMQRELLNAVMGFGAATSGPDVGKAEMGSSPTSKSPAFCVEGASRDMFVPLENELTSDSDGYENSWRHYLTLAKQSAATADDLGQQLLKIAFDKELRREGSGEALAAICGGAPSLSELSVDDSGAVKVDSKDEALKVCLDEPTTDIVFIGKVPTEMPKEPTTATAWLKTNVLRCSGAGVSNALCKKANLTTGGLNLVDAYVPPDIAKECADADGIITTLRSPGFNDTKYAAVLAQKWSSKEALTGLVGTIRMATDELDQWQVTVGGAIVMDSESPDHWPGCLGTGAGCDFGNHRLRRGLNRLFRNCGTNDTTREAPILGDCTDKAPAGGDSVRAEKNAIRWRVEGALYLLAGMTGSAPEGMFSGPVFVANRSMIGWSGGTGGDPFAARFLPNAFGASAPFSAVPGSGTTFDANALGTLYPISANFAALSTSAVSNELPTWAPTIVGSVNRYISVLASTPSLARKPRGQAIETISEISAREVGASLGGMRCPLPYGSPEVSASISDESLLFKLGAAKTNLVNEGLWNLGRVRTMRQSVTSETTLKFVQGYENSSGGDWAYWTGPACTMEVVDGAKFANASKVTPGERLIGFINSAAPCSPCEAAHQLAQAVSFACYGASLGVTPSEGLAVPKLATADDLPLLESWIAANGVQARMRVAGLFLENVPQRVVADFKDGRVGTGSTSGSHGERILEMEEQLQTLVSSWKSVTVDLDLFQGALKGARNTIAGGDIAKRRDAINLSIQQYRVYRDMVASAGQVVSSVGSGVDPYSKFFSVLGSSISAAATTGFGFAELAEIGKLKDLSGEENALLVQKALNDLRMALGPTWADMEKNLGAIRSSVARLRMSSSALEGLASKAKYEAAKGLGKDYVVAADGKATFLPVNIVLRRQYDALSRRYKDATKNARYQAFLARRAIEQRLGQRLETMVTKLGPLDAPSKWADDLCRAGGFDYTSLSSTSGVGPGADAAADEKMIEFADSFIGDYVKKLENLVEYYNVEYPSHDGDDTAVLSLREDLLSPKAYCTSDAPNLLYYSGNLAALSDGVAPASGLDHRWQLVTCATGAAKCLQVDPGVALPTPKAPPATADRGGVTWLHDGSSGAGGGDAGTDAGSDAAVDGGDAGSPMSIAGPAGVVFQTVRLDPGTYVLSWWDQARTSDGAVFAAGTAPAYRVFVANDAWTTVAVAEQTPFVATAATFGAWSTRRALAVKIETAGIYRVAFSASLIAGDAGSVAIANAQLEVAPAGGAPTPYVATDATRTVIVNSCATRSAEELRSAFQYRCDAPGSCYYELAAPIVLDTGLLGTPTTSLIGKLARGNFNFRHIDLAVNLVGTGVRDCSRTPTSGCYGSGYTEYTLEHDGTHAGVVGWDGRVQFFDFGVAPIEHGKALSAERYITMPIGGADTTLLQQPGIMKPEYRGRPLDGSYRLKIWDSSALQFNRLDDVQFVLKYRYWSRLTRKAKGD